ncbi:MAG: hypothetical protein HYS27_06505 [Deltaproteobacteria bacterium]|nr:hypothetical protein [Deltaproteobacteria bacterium]
MMQLIALEAQNRLRAERPVVLVVTRKKCAAAERAVRAFSIAADALEIDAVAMDADSPDNATFLDDHGVSHVPECLLFARGVVLERSAGARDDVDATRVLAAALRKRRP